MQELVKTLHNSNDYDDGDEIVEWYDDYKQRKTQKWQINEELILTVWHLSRWWDLSMSEDEEKETEKLWNDE